jgi:hypothetical protein
MKLLISKSQFKNLKKYLKNFINENDEYYYQERNNPKAPWNREEPKPTTIFDVIFEFLFQDTNEVELIMKADVDYEDGQYSIENKNIRILNNSHNISKERIIELINSYEVEEELHSHFDDKIENTMNMSPEEKEILIQNLNYFDN